MDIYVVKLFQHTIGSCECCGNVAWFSNHDDAVKCVETNSCDIADDGYFNIALIVKLNEGCYPICNKEDEEWFVYDKNEKCFKRTDLRFGEDFFVYSI